tara:strand:+ start:47 stop:700 length:654 start_codon:yes stop_codon:yes gene_type:complete
MATKIAVIISGEGSNLQALINACADKEFPANIVLVISNNPEANGLKKADAAGIQRKIIYEDRHSTRESFDEEMAEHIKSAGVELICLAGFMRLLSPKFVNDWQDKIINIHPSLLPAFKGLNVHSRVLKMGTMFSGCTVHFVRPDVDDGPILIQSVVPVLPNDSEETLGARVLAQEHIIYPMAVRWIAQNRVKVVSCHTEIQGSIKRPRSVINPYEYN